MSALRIRRRASERGQGLVEFAIILPILMVLLLGLVEFGFIFQNHQGLEYATREGARTASALANGQNGQNGQPFATTCSTIDNQVIAAVQRVVTSKGSPVTVANITRIRIYKYDDATQAPDPSFINVWTPGVGPTADGGAVTASNPALKFKQTGGSWNPCLRLNGSTPDVVGVDLTYSYQMTTALGALLKWTGANVLAMNDATVMVLNP